MQLFIEELQQNSIAFLLIVQHNTGKIFDTYFFGVAVVNHIQNSIAKDQIIELLQSGETESIHLATQVFQETVADSNESWTSDKTTLSKIRDIATKQKADKLVNIINTKFLELLKSEELSTHLPYEQITTETINTIFKYKKENCFFDIMKMKKCTTVQVLQIFECARSHNNAFYLKLLKTYPEFGFLFLIKIKDIKSIFNLIRNGLSINSSRFDLLFKIFGKNFIDELAQSWHLLRQNRGFLLCELLRVHQKNVARALLSKMSLSSNWASDDEKATIFCAFLNDRKIRSQLIATINIDYNNGQAICEAISSKNQGLILELAKQGAHIPVVKIIRTFGAEIGAQILCELVPLYPITNSNAHALYIQLCQAGGLLFVANSLLEKAKKIPQGEWPEWFKDTSKLTQLFFALGEAVFEEKSPPQAVIQDLTLLATLCDVNAKDQFGQTPIMYVAQILKNFDLVTQLVKRGGRLSDEAEVDASGEIRNKEGKVIRTVQGTEVGTKVSVFQFVCNAFDIPALEQRTPLLVPINNDSPKLVTILLQGNFIQEALFLFEALQKEQPTEWDNAAKKQFLQAAGTSHALRGQKTLCTRIAESLGIFSADTE